MFLTGASWLAVRGAPDERGFWPVLLAALVTGWIFVADRRRYAETVVHGMAQPVVLLMIAAWLLAGALAGVLAASGFVDALVWSARALDLRGGAYAAAAFLACAIVSTSTGTSFGTLLICGPLLYPAAAGAGVHPGALLGAILGGATLRRQHLADLGHDDRLGGHARRRYRRHRAGPTEVRATGWPRRDGGGVVARRSRQPGGGRFAGAPSLATPAACRWRWCRWWSSRCCSGDAISSRRCSPGCWRR